MGIVWVRTPGREAGIKMVLFFGVYVCVCSLSLSQCVGKLCIDMSPKEILSESFNVLQKVGKQFLNLIVGACIFISMTSL